MQEFDVDETVGVSSSERLARQRAALKKRLGLNAGAGADVIDSAEMFDDNDLAAVAPATRAATATQSAAELLASMDGA
jgi:hypothetical protein